MYSASGDVAEPGLQYNNLLHGEVSGRTPWEELNRSRRMANHERCGSSSESTRGTAAAPARIAAEQRGARCGCCARSRSLALSTGATSLLAVTLGGAGLGAHPSALNVRLEGK